MTRPLARWAAGCYGDRRSPDRLLIPATLATAISMAGLLDARSPAAVLVGTILLGTGFGAARNVALTLMRDRVPHSEFGRVSVPWSLAYDTGMGAEAAGFGLLASAGSYLTGFTMITIVLLAGLVPAWRDQAKEPL